jgi:hypothetical protein
LNITKRKKENKVDVFCGILQQEACLFSIAIFKKKRKVRKLTSAVRKQPRS